jgi:decaprenylphospho-beta-D-ribofuranose 2-oxidase
MAALPFDQLERTEAWGQASSAMDYVFRPSTVDELRRVFAIARATGRSIGLRGAGRSYGDAAMNSEGILIDFSRMNRILRWNPDRGLITVEPGVTIEQLWRYVLGDGWWPPVVPGTMFPTIGGCAAMNVHGKNNWEAGPIGNHIPEFCALLPDGREIQCDPTHQVDLFQAFIGGLGMLGCFTQITLQLKKIYSGRLKVTALAVPDIAAMLRAIEDHQNEFDYLVGWVDGFARGKSIGRGQIHLAAYLPPGADPAPAQSLRIDQQDLPDTFFGLLPKSILWRLMKRGMNNPGVRFVNAAKYWMSRRQHGRTYEQSLVAFNFLLDYVPNWKKAYLPGGLIQYQSFIPKAAAAEAFRDILARCQSFGLPTYLGVVKRHRPDPFLMTHSVDGFSLAMDFKVTRRNRARLSQLAKELNAIVLAASGRFYFAKDSTLEPETARAYLGEDTLARFKALKQQCDPEGLLQTDLARRVLPDLYNGQHPN